MWAKAKGGAAVVLRVIRRVAMALLHCHFNATAPYRGVAGQSCVKSVVCSCMWQVVALALEHLSVEYSEEGQRYKAPPCCCLCFLCGRVALSVFSAFAGCWLAAGRLGFKSLWGTDLTRISTCNLVWDLARTLCT